MALESGIQLKESGIPVSNDGNTVQTRRLSWITSKGRSCIDLVRLLLGYLFETLLLNEEAKVILVPFCLN